MKEKCKTFVEITSGAADCLREKRSRSEGTIRHYHVLWRKVKKYMESQQIECFDSTVGKDYLLQEFGNRDYSKLSKPEKDLVRGVNILCEFQETGSLLPVKEQTVFDGPIGQLMTKYLSYKTSLRLKKSTIDEQEQHLYRFLCYLNEHDIPSVNAINQLHVLYFIKGIDPRFSTLPHLTLRTLRGFFSYLYDQLTGEMLMGNGTMLLLFLRHGLD